MVATGRRFLLSAERINKSYRGSIFPSKRKPVLENVGLRVASGEAVALVGANGTGKSTLLQICAGVLNPDRGSGKITRVGAVGYCPQKHGLLEMLTVDEHIQYVGKAKGLKRNDALYRGRRLLDALKYEGDAEKVIVGNLNGGNCQKLSLVLAMLGGPEIVLLDEPDQGFDPETQQAFWTFLRAWRQERAVVVVTHSLPHPQMTALGYRLVRLVHPAPTLPGAAERW